MASHASSHAGSNSLVNQSSADSSASTDRLNVGSIERIISGIAGTALVGYGLKKRSLPGLGLALVGGLLARRGATGKCELYRSLGIDTAHASSGKPEEYFEHGIHVEKAVTVNKSPQELYDFWRRLDNLPRFMRHLKSVEVIDDTHSRWVAHAPAGTTVQWEAEIINDDPGSVLAWRSVEGSDVPNSGAVRFRPAPVGRGTEVKVTLEYLPPAGKLGVVIAKLFGEEPGQQIKGDLRRFKQLMETGEIPTTDGQPAGRNAFQQRTTARRSPAAIIDHSGADRGKSDSNSLPGRSTPNAIEGVAKTPGEVRGTA
ncbi:MAG: DUF2892 domain-containing protein [Phycisphaerales bacterium]|nr:DUF2892 domain-containing protein [Phycisphaerales bacterium]